MEPVAQDDAKIDGRHASAALAALAANDYRPMLWHGAMIEMVYYEGRAVLSVTNFNSQGLAWFWNFYNHSVPLEELGERGQTLPPRRNNDGSVYPSFYPPEPGRAAGDS